MCSGVHVAVGLVVYVCTCAPLRVYHFVQSVQGLALLRLGAEKISLRVRYSTHVYPYEAHTSFLHSYRCLYAFGHVELFLTKEGCVDRAPVALALTQIRFIQSAKAVAPALQLRL